MGEHKCEIVCLHRAESTACVCAETSLPLSNRNVTRKKKINFENANTINLTSSVALEKMPQEFGPKWWRWSMAANIPATFCQPHRLSIGLPCKLPSVLWHQHTRGVKCRWAGPVMGQPDPERSDWEAWLRSTQRLTDWRPRRQRYTKQTLLHRQRSFRASSFQNIVEFASDFKSFYAWCDLLFDSKMEHSD